MRRFVVVLGVVLAALWVAAPASAFAHDRVTNPYLHAGLDVLVLAVVTAPVWTAYLWGGHRRALLAGLIALVQLPVAFVPIADPGLHATALTGALALTVAALVYARRSTAPATASRPA